MHESDMTLIAVEVPDSDSDKTVFLALVGVGSGDKTQGSFLCALKSGYMTLLCYWLGSVSWAPALVLRVPSDWPESPLWSAGRVNFGLGDSCRQGGVGGSGEWLGFSRGGEKAGDVCLALFCG